MREEKNEGKGQSLEKGIPWRGENWAFHKTSKGKIEKVSLR